MLTNGVILIYDLRIYDLRLICYRFTIEFSDAHDEVQGADKSDAEPSHYLCEGVLTENHAGRAYESADDEYEA